jgi:hypothetical protein
LAKANGEKDKISKASNKIFDPKYSMPRWCSLGLTHSQKPKLQRLREKENREKGAEKIFNDTHPQYPRPYKNGYLMIEDEARSSVRYDNLIGGDLDVDDPRLRTNDSSQSLHHCSVGYHP